MSARRRLAVALLVGVCAGGCPQGGEYPCTTDADCIRSHSDQGRCEIEGYCSFPDNGCPGARRFGEYASSQWSGRCVPGRDQLAGETTSTGSSSGSTGSGTTGDPEDGSSTSSSGAGSSDESSSSSSGDRVCGDGEVEAPELCDGVELGGVDCTDFGFSGGVLACAANCLSFDVGGCS